MRLVTPNLSLYLLILILLGGCATGSSIVVGEVRPAIEPSQVKLFLEPHEAYETIGIVKASSDTGWAERDSVNYAVKELKNQAAKLGANGVLIETSSQNSSTIIGGQGTGYLYAIPVIEQSVTGKAISVAP